MKNERMIKILVGTMLLAFSVHAQTCIPPPAGLVGWWPGNGNARDIYGGNDGILENGATFGAGKVNQGFSFDGIDDYVMIPHNPNQNLTSFSLHAWIKIPYASSDFQTIIAKTDNTILGGETRNFGLHVMPNVGIPPSLQLIASFAYAPGAFAAVQNMTPVADGLFHHVVATFETSVGLKIYFDGVDQTEPTTYPSTGIGVVPGFITVPITIGINSPFANAYGALAGIVDEAALFNRALLPNEIQAVFAAGSAGMCSAVDTVGPVTSGVAVNPNPVAVGTGSWLTAGVSDATTGGSNVAAAYYSINGSAQSQMLVTPIGAVTTQASAILAPFSQSGVYNVCVHGTDSAGNTGADSCIPLSVYEPSQVPASKDACKNGGWQNLRRANGSSFKNQGDCIQYVNTGK